MLAKTAGHLVVIAGLLLSSSLTWGQFAPSGRQAEADAYRVMNNYMYQTVDASRLGQFPVAQNAFGPTPAPAYASQPGQFPVTQTAFGQTPTPAKSPFPTNIGSPALNLGVATGTGAAPAPVPNANGAGAAVDATPQLVPYAPTTGGYDWSSSAVAMGAPGGAPCADGSCGVDGVIYGDPLAAGCGDCCRGCCKFCFSAEYLYWWTKGQYVPQLVTTAPLGLGPGISGTKGHPDTTVLFGGGRLDDEGVSGGRFRGSMALDCNCCNKIDVEYFFLGDNKFDYGLEAPTDYDIIARPFYNPWIGDEDAEYVGYPGLVEGRIDISGKTSFDGWGAWWRHNLLCCCGGGCGPCGGGLLGKFGGGGGPLAAYGAGGAGCGRRGCLTPCRADLLLGYRRLNLDEELYIRESLTAIDPLGVVPVGTTFDIVDQFETDIQFDGFDVGMSWDWCKGKFGVNALTKIAFGRVRRRATVRGWTHITEPGLPPDSYDGGLLAASSNIGHFAENDFTVVPEVGLNMYCQVSCRCRLTFGYSLLFLADVWRPGANIDVNVDPRQLPPPTVFDSVHPDFKRWTPDFWAQGLNAGVEFCF